MVIFLIVQREIALINQIIIILLSSQISKNRMNFPHNFIHPERGYPYLPHLPPLASWNFPSIPPPYPMPPPYPIQPASLYPPQSNLSNLSIFSNQQHSSFYGLNQLTTANNRYVNPFFQKLFQPPKPKTQNPASVNQSKRQDKQKGKKKVQVIQILSDEQLVEKKTTKHNKKMIDKQRKIHFELKRLNCRQDPSLFIQKCSKQQIENAQEVDTGLKRVTRVSGKIPKQHLSVRKSDLKEEILHKEKTKLNGSLKINNNLPLESKKQQKMDDQLQKKGQIANIQYETALPSFLSSQQLQLQLKGLKQSLIQRKMANA